MRKRGQSIIEYLLIAVLVILGIVFMGPYALRSVNGYFKLWDGSIQDSFEENLSQAPVNVIPYIPVDECTPTTIDLGCGLNGCPSGQMATQTSWYPVGCNDKSTGNNTNVGGTTNCTSNCSCCAAAATAQCGSIALPPGSNGVPPAGNPPDFDGIDCYYRQRLYASPCAAPKRGAGKKGPNSCTPPASYCQEDDTCPRPVCPPQLPSNIAIPCPATNNNLNFPPVPDQWTYAASCPSQPADGTDILYCQYTCPANTVYVAGATQPCCTPSAAACPTNANCGTVSDGCGGKTTCGGSCTHGLICTANVCSPPPPPPPCTPQCAKHSWNISVCARIADGCGGYCPSGTLPCDSPKSCHGQECE